MDVSVKNINLILETEESLFSPHAVDAGTLHMLDEVEFTPGDKVLDLGCGYGVVGILAAKLIGEENVILCDVSERAAAVSAANASRNGLNNLSVRLSDAYSTVPEEGFTLILSNPPYHADFSVPKRFIEEGFRKLVVGGRLVMVTKRLDWYKNKLTAVFGGVKVKSFEDGYYVFISEKRSPVRKKKEKAAGGLSKKLQRKQNARRKSV